MNSLRSYKDIAEEPMLYKDICVGDECLCFYDGDVGSMGNWTGDIVILTDVEAKAVGDSYVTFRNPNATHGDIDIRILSMVNFVEHGIGVNYVLPKNLPEQDVFSAKLSGDWNDIIKKIEFCIEGNHDAVNI